MIFLLLSSCKNIDEKAIQSFRVMFHFHYESRSMRLEKNA